MSVVGVRVPGWSRIRFVTHELPEGTLRSGSRVLIETAEGQTEAKVVIAPGQFVSTDKSLPIAGVIIRIDPSISDASAMTSREDEAYRARKAEHPLLGSRIEVGDTSGTVTRIDLRNGSFDLRNDAGAMRTIPLAAINMT